MAHSSRARRRHLSGRGCRLGHGQFSAGPRQGPRPDRRAGRVRVRDTSARRSPWHSDPRYRLCGDDRGATAATNRERTTAQHRHSWWPHSVEHAASVTTSGIFRPESPDRRTSPRRRAPRGHFRPEREDAGRGMPEMCRMWMSLHRASPDGSWGGERNDLDLRPPPGSGALTAVRTLRSSLFVVEERTTPAIGDAIATAIRSGPGPAAPGPPPHRAGTPSPADAGLGTNPPCGVRGAERLPRQAAPTRPPPPRSRDERASSPAVLREHRVVSAARTSPDEGVLHVPTQVGQCGAVPAHGRLVTAMPLLMGRNPRARSTSMASERRRWVNPSCGADASMPS